VAEHVLSLQGGRWIGWWVGARSSRRCTRRGRPYLPRERGAAVLEALDEVAAAHETAVAAVALAWLLAQPRVLAPIASARTTEQLDQILPAATLKLTPAEVDRLTATTQ